jgi:hypothetical protein
MLRLRKETPIERIYRDVTGREMPLSVRRILLPKPRPKKSKPLDNERGSRGVR